MPSFELSITFRRVASIAWDRDTGEATILFRDVEPIDVEPIYQVLKEADFSSMEVEHCMLRIRETANLKLLRERMLGFSEPD